MKNILHKPTLIAITLVASTLPSISLAQNSIDAQRESIVIASRESVQALAQAIVKLQALYRQTADQKVRDDLIALLVHQQNFKQALAVCKNCKTTQFSQSELENLGLAARREQLFEQALALYQQLAKSHPDNPNGLLGSALVSTELGLFPQAKQALGRYQLRFGTDDGVKDALRYLEESEPDMTKLGRLQKELARSPQNTELALSLYRLSAKYNILPLQQELINDYPALFSESDKHWLIEAENITSTHSTSKKQVAAAYYRLDQLSKETNPEELIHQQLLQDKIALANHLGEPEWALEDYAQLQALGKEIPIRTQEEHADSLLATGSPFKALALYQQIEAQERSENNGHLSSSLLFKLVNAASDAGKFSLAQRYLDEIDEPAYINDYTHTMRIPNPYYDREFYATVNLAQWRGNQAKAIELLEERLTKVPGDPWTMLAAAGQKQARYHHDDALALAHKASAFLAMHNQKTPNVLRANVALDTNDWRTATAVYNGLTEQEKAEEGYFVRRYQNQKSARLVGSFSTQRKTFPKESVNNEVSQEYYLYSPKTGDGHEVYVHYLANNSPSEEENLRQRRIGAGANINFYPAIMNIEVGKGIKLHDKTYLSLGADYRLNQHWHFGLSGNLNGAGTPLKAIRQGVYTKDINLSASYTHNNIWQMGGSYGVMKFDDSNVRHSGVLWTNLLTFKRDRWQLENNFRMDYQKNKEVESAYYYNPKRSYSVEAGFDLSYYQPLDYNLKFTHHLKGNVGQYHQKAHPKENTWALSYGHQWQLGRKISLSYELGRKKNIYDGDREFNNFAHLNFTVNF